MPEWWSYSLSDFLLFSPRTYYRLIERHNEAVWPGQLIATAAGVGVVLLLRRGSRGGARVALGTLALLWAWVGWSFVWRRYATINWAAVWLGGLFAMEAILLGWLGTGLGTLRGAMRRDAPGVLGAILVAGALVLYPLLAPALGRGWHQAEVFGIVPDPTVLATLGLVLQLDGPPLSRRALLVAPLLWCLVSGATLLAMGSPEAWIVLPATPLVLALSLVRGRRAP
jgi:hypothetical protein